MAWPAGLGLPDTYPNWVPTVPGESPEKYLERVLAKSTGWGLIRGTKQLAVRVKQGVPSSSRQICMHLTIETPYYRTSTMNSQSLGVQSISRYNAYKTLQRHI